MTGPIIGLCGPAKSGKSLAAQYLANKYRFERVRFAGPLKAMLAALGLTQEQIEGDHKEHPSALLGGKTPRHAMITLGTEWGRDLIDPDLWVNAWWRAVERVPNDRPVVAEDCRFANEARIIRAHGGLIIRIDRPGVGIATDHVSERPNFEPDLYLENDGTPADLCDKLDSLMKVLLPSTMRVESAA